MKYLKMLGLAAVAAMAVMALVGAGTASADEVCTKNENPCKPENQVTKIESSLSAGKSAVLESEGITLDTCTTGTVAGSITSQGPGIEPNGAITSLTWGTVATPCTNTTDTTKLGKLRVKSVAGNGTVTGSESEVTVFVKSLGVTCTYGTGSGTDLGTIAGGTNKLVISASIPKTAGGFTCPSSSTWTAEYTVTNHSVLYFPSN